MARLFDERERAAENMYAHDEELNFLARRRGLQMTARWAAESMGLDAEAVAAYEVRLVDSYVAGASESDLVRQIQMDIERAGKPTMAPHVSTQLAQAIAEAGLFLRGTKGGVGTADQHGSPREEWARHHPKHDPSWGWGS